jgi:hypothetical protein
LSLAALKAINLSRKLRGEIAGVVAKVAYGRG